MESWRKLRTFFGENKKENNKHKNKKISYCDFCGSIAKQIIVSTKGKMVLSCFDCIPLKCKGLAWIKSAEKII